MIAEDNYRNDYPDSEEELQFSDDSSEHEAMYSYRQEMGDDQNDFLFRKKGILLSEEEESENEDLSDAYNEEYNDYAFESDDS